MAEFLIKDSFVFTSRKLFTLIGDILSGELKEGMILLPQNGVGAVLMISSVEEVRGGAGHVGLLFKYEHENELEILKDMKNHVALIA